MQLTFKLVTLLLLVTAQWGQIIHQLSFDGMVIEQKRAVFHISVLLKLNRVGDRLELKSFDDLPLLRFVRTL